MKILAPLFFLLALAQSSFAADPHSIPAFPIMPNDLELTRLAQPGQYFDKIGTCAALMGVESGQFELWIWPWKPLRNFELQFLLGTSTEPIRAKDIVRTISVTPEMTTITYTYESFSVKEHFLVPRGEAGVILLLEVHTTEHLAIIPGFLPVVQPMWPAGIGGQFSYWDDELNGYVLSEGQWRAVFVCGSPAAKQMAAPPAHMFADAPLQFRIDVAPGEAEGRYIPVVIAGSRPDGVGGKMPLDSVKSTYTRLWKNAESYYKQNAAYYNRLRSSTVQVITPESDMNLAYEWGKVALDNLMVVNPRLGRGLVAGYGLSGNGTRPGFAWFFGGDAFINSLAMNSYGDRATVRDALLFTQRWQRQDNFPVRKKNLSDPPKDIGKMSHELSQSDGLCDWWNDYHYGYNHADTSPWYIVALADYVRSSGDTAFLRGSWGSVRLAYDWCLSKDSDGDGLMDLKGAGLGALEFGKLVGIYADVYTCGVFVQAVKEMTYLAGLLGDSAVARQSATRFAKAGPRLEKLFWLDKEGFYSYGATERGEQVHEKGPWSGVAMMYGLLDEERSEQSLEATNGGDLCTDWGVRSLSKNSPLFDPVNYNYGAVWPFISSFYNTAQFRYEYSSAAYRILRATVSHAFDHALGVVPEVFSGALNEKLGEGYHHQGFSTTGYMLPFLRGLIGMEVDALHSSVRLAPHFPPAWNRLEIRDVAVGAAIYDFVFSKAADGWRLAVTSDKPGSLRLSLAPDFLPITKISNLRVTRSRTGDVLQPDAEGDYHFQPSDGDSVFIRYNAGPSLNFPNPHSATGDQNNGLKIIREKYDRKSGKLVLIVEGKSGQAFRIGVNRSDLVKTVEGAAMVGSEVVISFDANGSREFIRKEITITPKE